jgi:anti-sigma regulatory factor (Ser/Thr protein kinase)
VTQELPDRTADELALLTSEVVSNAVRHASRNSADEIIVRVATDGGVRVEVVDAGTLFEPPSPREPWDGRPNGWGLLLVDAVARAWGVDAEGTAKKVWFELDDAA